MERPVSPDAPKTTTFILDDAIRVVKTVKYTV